MRSSAPGAKFSTSTSQCLTSRSRMSLPLRVLGIDRDRALVAVEHREIEAVGALHVAQLAARDVADARPLDLDAVGAHVGQKLRAGRPDCTCVKSRIFTPSSALPACPYGFCAALAVRCGLPFDFLALTASTTLRGDLLRSPFIFSRLPRILTLSHSVSSNSSTSDNHDGAICGCSRVSACSFISSSARFAD